MGRSMMSESGARIYLGDCIEIMRRIDDSSIDMILVDPPYGCLSGCRWDTAISLPEMWKEFNRIIKPHGAIAVFCAEPFTSILIGSNLKGFKYRWTWDKVIPSGIMYAKYRPMQQTEDIAIFTRAGEKTIYFPQMEKRDKPIKGGGMKQSLSASTSNCIALKKTYEYKNPTTLLRFMKIRKGAVHPTEKPVALLEYLIRTYTQEGETVLDACMGSGSTGIACRNTGRRFVGIEIDSEYYQIARERIFAGSEEV